MFESEFAKTEYIENDRVVFLRDTDQRRLRKLGL